MYAVDRKKWDKLTIFDQMGNIYSEVGRAFKSKRLNKLEDSQQAMIRALDLFDATTTSQIKNHPARAKEILRAREQFLQVLLDESISEPDIKSLDMYFMHFAVAARLQAI